MSMPSNNTATPGTMQSKHNQRKVRNTRKIISIAYDKAPKRTNVKFIAPPFRFDGKTFSDFSIGPRLGEHTSEILESLGYNEDVQKLGEKQIIIVSRKNEKHGRPS